MNDIKLETYDRDTVTVHLLTASAIVWADSALVGEAAVRISPSERHIPRGSVGHLIYGAEGYGLSFETTSAYLQGRPRSA